MDRRQLLGIAIGALAGPGMAAPPAARNLVVGEVKLMSPDDAGWVAHSVAADDLAPRFAFVLRPTVYTGDPNNHAQFKMAAYNPPLTLPAFARQNPLRAFGSEAIGHETELAAYYRQIMALTGPAPLTRAQNYWLQLTFVTRTAGTEIGFAWWDRLSDMAEFLAWLRSAPDGKGFLDLDQGWMIHAFRKDGRLYFQDSDPDEERELSNLNVDRSAFLDRLTVAEQQIRVVIGHLRSELGVDPWS